MADMADALIALAIVAGCTWWAVRDVKSGRYAERKKRRLERGGVTWFIWF